MDLAWRVADHQLVRTLAVACTTTICLLLGSVTPASAAHADKAEFVAATPNLDRVLFSTRASLASSDTDGSCRDIYLREGDDVTLVSNGANDSCTHSVGWAETNRSLTQVAFQTRLQLSSNDSDRRPDVYVWDGGAPELVAPEAKGEAHLIDVSDEGSSVFFSSKAELAAEDTDRKRDIYRMRANQVELVTLNTVKPPDGFTQMSDDGSVVLFYTSEALLAADQDVGCEEYRCEDDVYRWSAGSLELVSTGPSDPGTSGAQLSNSTSDGRYVYFSTADSMTPDDTNGTDDVYQWAPEGVTRLTPDPVGDEASREFRVSLPVDDRGGVVVATTSRLVGTDLDDAPDLYAVTQQGIELMDIPDGNPRLYEPEVYYVSPGMERIIFIDEEPLVGRDKNTLEDIYEWEPSSGIVKLVSGGKDENFGYYEFKGSTRSGDRTVFDSNHPLVPGDSDSDGTDSYATETGSGDFELLSTDAPGPEVDVYTEAVNRSATSVVVRSYEPLSSDDTDGYDVDLYLISPGHDPQLVSG